MPEDSARATAHEIFDEVTDSGRKELRRSSLGLFISGLAGGLTMGLTGLSVAVVRATLGPGSIHDFVAALFYPIGFIAVIIGRAQLFTENTLFPVALILSEKKQFKKKHLKNTARLWAVVFISNVFGALGFGWLAVKSGGLKPEFINALTELGVRALQHSPMYIFWSGIFGGWLIALVAWEISGSHNTIGQIALIWLLTFVVGLGQFAHCIATSGEILSAVLAGSASGGQYVLWLLLATAGNIAGGVVIVTLLNYGQVQEEL